MENITDEERTQLIHTGLGITPEYQDQEDFIVHFAYIFDVFVKIKSVRYSRRRFSKIEIFEFAQAI